MSKTILRSNSISLVVAIVLIGSLFIISSCGGGGGGGSTPVTYDGLVTQASISSTNANAIFSEVWNGDITSGSAGLGKASSTNLKGSGMVAVIQQVRDRALSRVTGVAAGSSKIMTATAVSDTYYGRVSGFLRITGDVDQNTMLGTLNMTFSNFNDGDGVTINGTVTFRIDGFDTTYYIITDGTMTFTLWTIKAADCDISLTGSIRVQENLALDTETVTIDLDGRNNTTGDTFRYQNLQVVTVYDDITLDWPTILSESINGRVYVGQYGYVEISTTNPLTYTAALIQDHPSGGGPLVLTGAGGSKAVITPTSDIEYTIAVDVNGDDIYEWGPVPCAW